jgi:hypothetical protein
MKRDDKLSRQLGLTERRKRRNLTSRGVLSEAVGGGGDGCPNIGPPEAAEQFVTDTGTGTILGHTYTDVIISQTGLMPGVDVLTYCFYASVGGPDNPVDVSCDGTLGLTQSGILSQPNWANGLPTGWKQYGIGVGYGIKDGWATVAMVPTEGLCNFIQEGGGVSYVYYETNSPAAYVQTYCTFEGTNGLRGEYTTLGGSNGQLVYQTAGGAWGEFAGICHPTVQAGAAYASIQQGNGIFAGVTYAVTGAATGTQSFGLLKAVCAWDGGNDGTTSFARFGSSATTSDPLAADTSSGDRTVMLQTYRDCDTRLLTETRTCDPGGPTFSVETGRVWYYNTLVMSHKDVTITGVPDGYYGYLSNGQLPNGTMESIDASVGGTLTIEPIHRHWFTEADTDRPQWTGEYPMHHLELWDGEPYEAGSTKIVDCDIARGVYGGDIWAYDSGGIGGGSPVNVESTIRLEFLSSSGSVIASYEPAGGTTTTPTLITQADITVPALAQRMRFKQYKKGTGEGYGIVDDLQVNNGPICCPFTNPINATTNPSFDVDLGNDESDDDGGDGSSNVDLTELIRDVALSIDEHRQGGGNLIVDSRDERTISAQTGNVDGDDYPTVVLSEHGLVPGDRISIRGKAKVT